MIPKLKQRKRLQSVVEKVRNKPEHFAQASVWKTTSYKEKIEELLIDINREIDGKIRIGIIETIGVPDGAIFRPYLLFNLGEWRSI